MKIEVNGEPLETSARCVADLVREVLGDGSQDGVAVAIANVVVRRSEWATFNVCDGDRVEIIRAVGGG
ncbi:MAG: sulfur carrier protein ThiS [Myxococcales bacterium]|nr:sulfur carrier protein ThiS [Myxococcales bacterium]